MGLSLLTFGAMAPLLIKYRKSEDIDDVYEQRADQDVSSSVYHSLTVYYKLIKTAIRSPSNFRKMKNPGR